jgi:hypothetical protein
MRHTKEIYEEYARMRGMIVFILRKLPGKLNRVALCKNLYYSEMHYFQNTAKQFRGLTTCTSKRLPCPGISTNS